MKPSAEKETPGSPAAATLPMAVNQCGCRRIWGKASLAFVIGFFLSAGMAVAQNLLTNPGFETGSTTGWFGFGSPNLAAEASQVHSGNYACLVTNRNATYMGIAQSIAGVLEPGQTYNVSAWVKLASGTNQTMAITFQQVDGNGTTYPFQVQSIVTTNAWTQLAGTFTYSPVGTATAVTFYVEVPSSSTVPYYIDDASLSLLTATSPPSNGVSVVDWSKVHQRIDGFGASSAWNGSWTAAEADLLFSTNNNLNYQSGTYNGAGLSLLRSHIAFASNTSASGVPTTAETVIMQLAQARGARVWSTPWTPPAGFKSTNDIYDNLPITNAINGGTFLGSGNNATNINYASQLANFVASMKNSFGVNLYAISVQNEPDASVNTYEACQWNGTMIHDFVPNLFGALAARGLSSTQIIIPESEDWSGDNALYTPTLADANTAADVGIIANHNYVPDNSVGDQTVPAALATSGKTLWETEVALLSGSDSSIANGVYYAQRIYLYLTQAQANAYHYWWLVAYGSGNEGLLDTSAAPTKRLFTFGQYSRFVRPNFYRVDASSSQPSILISAYKATNSTAFAIVVVNTNAATNVMETLNLTNFTAASVTPWITSATLSLAPQTPVAITNGSFTYDLPAQSVVTFAGQGNTPPVVGAVPNQKVNAGVTLLLANTASDADTPAQTLIFSPANSLPAGAKVSPGGLFSWRPLVSQANTTNAIQIQVTDNGSPPLSATNRFTVLVNAVTNPVIGPVNLSHGQVSMIVNGPSGPDYSLGASTNLVNWQTVWITNSPPIPFTLTITNAADPAQFFRVQIGP